MITCPDCGKENEETAQYCAFCGRKISYRPSNINDRIRRKASDRELYSSDYLDGVGFGVFLIIIAWVYLQYSWIFNELIRWFSSWTSFGPTMIPVILVEPVSLFFCLMGGWGIIEGILRIISGRVRKGLSNIIGGLLGIGIAYMFRLYVDSIIASSMVLPIFLILIGISFVVSAIIELISN